MGFWQTSNVGTQLGTVTDLNSCYFSQTILMVIHWEKAVSVKKLACQLIGVLEGGDMRLWGSLLDDSAMSLLEKGML